ncbi:MAG: hypothetical protein HYV96_03930 [Opitutae bacterium]|nr:hypothetical protein [Opitutae bacterium]
MPRAPKPRLNREWHLAHRMPPRAPLDQRIVWHLEHRENCACRPIPLKLLGVLRERGLL